MARAAGFSPEQAQTMTSIALAESGGNSAQRSADGHSWGLWQINARAHPELSERYDLVDPLDNARAAYELSRSGTDLSPWTVTHGGGNRLGRHFLLGGGLALAAALVVGLWVGSTVGDSNRTSTQVSPAPPASSSAPVPTAPAIVTTPAPTPDVTEIPPTAEPSPPTVQTPEPPPEKPEPAAEPPSIVAVRAIPISPNGCVERWTAQVVVAVTGDVSSVTALWTGGGETTEVGLSPAGIAWTGQLADLPPRQEVQLTVRAEGGGGTVESDGQALAFPCRT